MIKTCERCGKEFDGQFNRKYCSDECFKAHRREDRLRRYRENAEAEREQARQRYYGRHEPKPPRIKACELCGIEFEAKTTAKYCPACRKLKATEASKRYRAANPEKVRANARRWREQNRARYNERQRNWRAANRNETPAREVADTREREREYKRRYRETHREEIREYARQYYELQRLKLERQRIIEKLFARRQHA